ncbi:MurR/RpiR family transcriptional regulator [Cohaesibacter celericrescens]|uniref:RpiR family transcriptional regulator n=1 Tax=Cohaesibacter celericrescens TaxID=2067669 RepID=A0A2N5XUU4_9HYPH|nr:SIS domain-containing protein [Cohaesibacter celericrescens]PLW78296.1 RpiR family transcriptional regulator [Cohaesibacter celericrescens]
MINIDFDALNPLEQQIHSTLQQHSKTVDAIRITQAADLCNCSVSKISKFSKKLGFATYKQYLDFLYDRKLPEPGHSSELQRVGQFIQDFDSSKVDELVKLINANDKLVLLGYGPSFLCAQYFEYRFKTCTNKVTIAVPDDLSATSMTDETTLLLIFTVTGTFKSFDDIYQDTKRKGGDVALIVEEYNPSLITQYDKIFCLTQSTQSGDLEAYEKSRTVFFIFMEEVLRVLMKTASGKRK